jgi:hypothetical protein
LQEHLTAFTIHVILFQTHGVARIKPIVRQEELAEDEDRDESRVAQFISALGRNNGFARFYFICKTLAAISPVLQWLFLCGFLGQAFSLYGVDVILDLLIKRDPWPGAMDTLFPKVNLRFKVKHVRLP